jgi:Ca2+-binding RTX toxin-like protein
MIGGAGNDVYTWRQFEDFIPGFTAGGVYVPGRWVAARDTIQEAPGGGIDTALLRSDWPNHVAGSITAAQLANVEIVRVLNEFVDWTITTGAEANRIFSRSGDDRIDAGAGADYVAAGAGNDTLTGGLGNDTLSGEAGDDRLIGGAGADRLLGGLGRDIVSYAEALLPVVVNLATGRGAGGDAQGDAYNGIEDVEAGRGADRIVGNSLANALAGLAGNDTIAGDAGNDTLTGGAGRDLLRGDAGRDVIDGGLGSDTLIGGAGADDFRFMPEIFGSQETVRGASGSTVVIGRTNTALDLGADVIWDFEVGVDRLVVDSVRSGFRTSPPRPDPRVELFYDPRAAVLTIHFGDPDAPRAAVEGGFYLPGDDLYFGSVRLAGVAPSRAAEIDIIFL